MRTPANTFKQAIAAPGAQIGLWLGLTLSAATGARS